MLSQPALQNVALHYGGAAHLTPFVALTVALVRTESQSQEDLLQEALFALHRALEKTPRPDNPMAFATTVVQRAILRARRKWHREPDNYATDLSLFRGGAIDASLEEEFFLEALGEHCGAPARRAAELLLERDAIPHAPQRVRCRRSSTRPAYSEVRQTLGLTRREWCQTLTQIRAFTRKWLAA